MYKLIKDLYRQIDDKNKKKINYIILLMVVNAFTEAISMGSMLPFIQVMVTPDIILENENFSKLFKYFGVFNETHAKLLFTIIFGFSILIAGSLKVLLLYTITRASFDMGSFLSSKIYQKVLEWPYSKHTEKNSSELISAITDKTDSLVHSAILSTLNIASSLVIITVIITILCIVSLKVTFILFTYFIICYLLIFKIVSPILLKNSIILSRALNDRIKIVQEGLGAIREIILGGKQKIYSKDYIKIDSELRKVQFQTQFITSSPRYLIETLGLIIVSVISYSFFENNSELNNAMPIFAIFALGSQRLLPVAQQIYYSWSSLNGNKKIIIDTLEILNQNKEFSLISNLKNENKFFYKNLELHNIGHKYNDNYIFSGINFKINKGDRVGIIGRSGSGKSTLVDILSGLIKPSIGNLQLDGKIFHAYNNKKWQDNISMVSQYIYITDATIMENIAFGEDVKDVDNLRLDKAIKIAGLYEFIQSLSMGVQAKVGERGAQLSGGQRQRIGIARALYKNAEIIIMDEATSALDEITESIILDSLCNLDENITLISITHRKKVLNMCNNILDLNKIY